MVQSASRLYRGNSYTTAVVKKQMNDINGVILQSDVNAFHAKQNHQINKKL